MILISNDFLHKRKIYNFYSYNVFLAISTNIPQRLNTAFVLQGMVRNGLYFSKNVTIRFFVIKKQISKPLPRDKNIVNNAKVM